MAHIVKAEIFKLRYGARGYKLSYGAIDEVFPVLLRLQDDEGIVGWGEANPQQPFTDESADDVVAVLRERLLPMIMGQDASDPTSILAKLAADKPNGDLIARGAVDIALMDMSGKRRGMTVAALLGGAVRDRLPVSHPTNNGSAAEDMLVIDEQMKHGYRHFMLKMGDKARSIDEEVERVAALQATYGDRITIKVDANTGWTRDQARSFLEAVSDYPIFVEQPLDKNDVDGMAELQAGTELAISADETLTGMARAKELIEKRAARIFSIKISKNGGILNSQRIATLAAENDILCYPNSMMEGGITQAASLHLAATLTNLVEAGGSFRSVLRLDGDVTNFASLISNGVVRVPDGPGLGIEVDEDAVRSNALIALAMVEEGGTRASVIDSHRRPHFTAAVSGGDDSAKRRRLHGTSL